MDGPPISSNLHPERSVGFLITDVSHLLRRNFNRRAQALGLSQAQWRGLPHLSPGEGLGPSRAAGRPRAQPAPLTRHVPRLGAAGWVERCPDPTDRRIARLYLTAQAQPVLAEMQHAAKGMLDEALRGLSVDARLRLVDALCKMKRNLSDAEALAAPGIDSRKKRHVRRDRERRAR